MDDRIIGVIGQVLVGDALTNLLVPREHMLLWEKGLPEGEWRSAVQSAAEHPNMTRLSALLEGAFGVFLIYHAVRNVPRALPKHNAKQPMAGGSHQASPAHAE